MYFKNNSVFRGALMLIALLFGCWINKANGSEEAALGTFGFDIHHRYSDAVKDVLGVDGLPEKGTLDYYSAMAHRDHHLNARRLASSSSSALHLTFYGGNDTYYLKPLGYLHYAFAIVGTPDSTFIVALDTSTDLFWVPCDCPNCARSKNLTSGEITLNIYSPRNSSSSALVACDSATCGPTRGCSAKLNACAYKQEYLTINGSSTGILVDDVLHLGPNAKPQNNVDASITLGCGMNQTGDLLEKAAINGVFGLGMGSISVPSILASQGLAADSFSLCFGSDGGGRIVFGDKGTPDQNTTPFNIQQSSTTYNITVTQVSVGNNATTDLEFTAIFDSGSSFTHLNDPAYSFILHNFNAQVNDTRYQPPANFIFDICYEISKNSEDSFVAPKLNLTMKGGSQYVTAPTLKTRRPDGGLAYCLAILKSQDINIIGQNFMIGYRIVYDREEMVLGWRESDCYDSSSLLNSGSAPRNRTRTPVSSPPPPPTRNDAAHLSSMTTGLLTVIVAIFSHQPLGHAFFVSLLQNIWLV